MHDLFYYKDAYMTQFTAEVVQIGTDDRGTYVVLNNTAFYPEGGGQPNDVGTLNGVRVVDVQKVDGDIRHYTESPITTTDVNGEVDWHVRFDYMQQHAGQHILTAAFVEQFGYETVSFHLGSDTVTIDLETEQVTADELQRAEDRANEIVRLNRPIETIWVTAEQAATYPLRKQLKFTDDVRLVIIPDFDYNGCGGTHPRATGEVAMIKIMHTERMKQKTRVHFMCGERVRQNMGERKRIMQQAAALLSRPESDIAIGIDALLTTNKQLEKQLAEAREALLAIDIAKLAQATQPFVTAAFEGYSMQQLQKVARTVVQQAPHQALALVSHIDDKLQVVIAKGKESTLPFQANELLKMILPTINGRGGGKPDFAQGGGEASISAQQLIATIEGQQ